MKFAIDLVLHNTSKFSDLELLARYAQPLSTWHDAYNHYQMNRDEYRYILVHNDKLSLINPYEKINRDDSQGLSASYIFAIAIEDFQALCNHEKPNCTLEARFPESYPEMKSLCELNLGLKKLFEQITFGSYHDVETQKNIKYLLFKIISGPFGCVTDIAYSSDRIVRMGGSPLTKKNTSHIGRMTTSSLVKMMALKIGVKNGTYLSSALLPLLTDATHVNGALMSGVCSSVLATFAQARLEPETSSNVSCQLAENFVQGIFSYTLTQIPFSTIYSAADDACGGYLKEIALLTSAVAFGAYAYKEYVMPEAHDDDNSQWYGRSLFQ